MKLYIIPTPIGNLEDITIRALRILKEVDFILCEDTRTTKNLLKHYDIDKKCIPYHINNEHQQLQHLIQLIKGVGSVALTSDAGTPGISDPGFLLIRECIGKGISVECLPGATAFVPALINSGLPAAAFIFTDFSLIRKEKRVHSDILPKWKKLLFLRIASSASQDIRNDEIHHGRRTANCHIQRTVQNL
jgi:16S rRNA (cytidine1402-2'-O)-methyltransferase